MLEEGKFQHTKRKQTTMHTTRRLSVQQTKQSAVRQCSQASKQPTWALLSLICKNYVMQRCKVGVSSAGRCVVHSCLWQPKSMQRNRLPLFYSHVYTLHTFFQSPNDNAIDSSMFLQITNKQRTSFPLDIPYIALNHGRYGLHVQQIIYIVYTQRGRVVVEKIDEKQG